MAIIKGTLYYPHFLAKNDVTQKFEVTVGNLDKQSIQVLKENKITPKKMEDKYEHMGYAISLRSDFAPKITDSKGRTLSESIIGSIGNGTVAKIAGNIYEWKFKGRKGLAMGLKEIRVLELKKYESVSEFTEEDEGFEVDEESSEFDTENVSKPSSKSSVKSRSTNATGRSVDEDELSDMIDDDDDIPFEEEDAA